MRLRAEIIRAFRSQAATCRRMGSPFTAGLCLMVADGVLPEGPLAMRLEGWPGDADADALALRLAGAFHHLARSGDDPGLQAVYPPAMPPEAALAEAVAAAADRHGPRLARMLDGAPQTNEVARSAILIGGLQVIAAETGTSLDLMEIGAAAGLNLMADAWGYEFGDGLFWGPANAPLMIESRWDGVRPALKRLCIAGRAGCDVAPIDPDDPEDRERLLCYVWPDQAGRLARTEAALAYLARSPFRVERADAADWLEDRLSRPPQKGACRVLMHSIMWQYLPSETRRRVTEVMVRAAERAGRETPLAWLRVEADGDRETAAVILTTWPGRRTRELARADFHGRFVHWTGAR